jgi:hypothetical protein
MVGHLFDHIQEDKMWARHSAHWPRPRPALQDCIGTCYNDIQVDQGRQLSDKLNIANEMRQLDRKNRNFYRELTEEERKKFSNYLMIRWASCVEGSREMQEFYLISTNARLNKHFFQH